MLEDAFLTEYKLWSCNLRMRSSNENNIHFSVFTWDGGKTHRSYTKDHDDELMVFVAAEKG